MLNTRIPFPLRSFLHALYPCLLNQLQLSLKWPTVAHLLLIISTVVQIHWWTSTNWSELSKHKLHGQNTIILANQPNTTFTENCQHWSVTISATTILATTRQYWPQPKTILVNESAFLYCWWRPKAMGGQDKLYSSCSCQIDKCTETFSSCAAQKQSKNP